jgi:hypothetical protein
MDPDDKFLKYIYKPIDTINYYPCKKDSNGLKKAYSR